ncbi:MAG TPA: hypothetical protein VI318_21740 [Baekduia sp.]
MQTARQRAGVLALAAVLALAGLACGLSLKESGAATTAVPAGTAAAASVPAAQTDLVESQADTAPDPGVPTTDVPVATSQDPAAVNPDSEAPAPKPVTGVGVGSAELQQPAAKTREARVSCTAHPPATSSLLSLGGVASGEPHRALVKPLVAIAAAGGALAFVMFLVRRRRTANADRRSTLEVAGTAVAIVGTLGAFAVNYFGAGVKDHPPPSVTMTVREVHARVTHGAYEDAVGVPPGVRRLGAVDRREIGNVVWLEVHTVGYDGARLRLQWAMFHAGPGEPFIQDTKKHKDIKVDGEADVETQFLPIWIGSPRVRRFRAEFRVLDGEQVRQIASTGPMRGIAYRYAC